jgi:hypothetical protein
MKYIGTITSDPIQNIKLITDDGSKIDLTFEYHPMRQGWYYSFKWGDFEVKNRRLITGYNILRQFRNILPFGFSVTVNNSPQGNEAVFQDDFSNGRAQFYLLNSEDVADVEEKISIFDERLA